MKNNLLTGKTRFQFLAGLAVAIFVVLIIWFIFFITTSKVKPDDTNKILSTLTSEEFQGRLVGTLGNEKAGNYIADQFKALGLHTFDEDYFQKYTQKLMDHTEFTIHYKDGSVKNMCYGADFLNPNREQGSIHLSGRVNFDKKNIQKNDIFVAEDDKNTDMINSAIETGAAGVLVKYNQISPLPVYSDPNVPYPVVFISPELYDQLESSEVKSITAEYSEKTKEVKNVIGKIPGKDHKKAVIISSHFDHLGSAGTNFYPGAADNASGVTVMLHTAGKLYDYSKKNPFDADIFFTSFNGEELGLFGSKYFADWIAKQYSSIYDINIDTIGGKNADELLLSGDRTVCSKLFDRMSKVIPKYIPNYKFQDGKSNSDYASFVNKGLCAINFAQKGTRNVHTVHDTPDNIDIGYLDRLSDIISDFLETNQKNLP